MYNNIWMILFVSKPIEHQKEKEKHAKRICHVLNVNFAIRKIVQIFLFSTYPCTCSLKQKISHRINRSARYLYIAKYD